MSYKVTMIFLSNISKRVYFVIINYFRVLRRGWSTLRIFLFLKHPTPSSSSPTFIFKKVINYEISTNPRKAAIRGDSDNHN